jgi:hypothetical protein
MEPLPNYREEKNPVRYFFSGARGWVGQQILYTMDIIVLMNYGRTLNAEKDLIVGRLLYEI